MGLGAMKDNGEYDNAHLQLFKVAPMTFAIFTEAGVYIETLDYKQARPLILKPKARAEYLEKHGVDWRAEYVT